VVDIVHDVSTLESLTQIGMTTNGITLTRHLPALVHAGLTHVNISLDTLQATKFTTLTRRPGLERVLESIQYAQELLPTAGSVKINCVVMKGVNDDELMDFIQLSHDWNVDIRFIEYMPFLNNGWNTNRFMSYDEMLNSIQQEQEQEQDYFLQRLQDGPNDTTKWYRWNNNNKNNNTTTTTARIGFITSMSQHFCGTCNRLRLTADGKLKVCLFGSQEVSLRDVLRANYPDQNQILERIIHYAVQNKPFSLGGHASAQAIANNAHDNRPMTLIGG
jgi:molybdenum cofactor biosynthesis enzyme MoaA